MTAPTLDIPPITAGRATITTTRRVIAGRDNFYVETTVGSLGAIEPLHTRPFATAADAADWAGYVAAIYDPTPSTPAELAPAAPITAPAIRTPTAAALANLTYAGWTPERIAAEVKVTIRTVKRWTAGSKPNTKNAAALVALSEDLAAHGSGCGCRGEGYVHTGEIWTTDGRADTYLRCSNCNKEV